MTDKKSEHHEYDVGYGKPPKEHRFQRGQSGNPRGRPKGSRNIKAILDEVLNKRQPVRENGTVKQRTTLEIVMLQLVGKSVKGDLKATAQLLSLYERHNLLGDTVEPTPTIDADDRALLDSFIDRMASKGEGADG